MRKATLFLTFCLLVTVLAQVPRAIPEEGIEPISEESPIEAVPISARERVQHARSAQELREIVQTREAELEEHMTERPPIVSARTAATVTLPAVARNQNQIRIAVHSFLAMEELAGPLGPQISEIARDFDNSVQVTELAESQIKSRGIVTKLLFGGDRDAARKIEAEVNRNKEKLSQIEQIKEDCPCDEETRQIMSEQINALRNEQQRLEALAHAEQNRRGILEFLNR